MCSAPTSNVRPHPWIAWIVILVIAAATIVLQSMGEEGAGDQPLDAASSAQANGLGDSDMVAVQGRPLLGLMQWVDVKSDLDALLANPQIVQQIRGWILLGTQTSEESRAVDGLAGIAAQEGGDSPLGKAALAAAAAMQGTSGVDTAALRADLGWFGALAIAIGQDGTQLKAMQQSAAGMLLILMGGFALVVLATLTGLVLGIIALTKLGSAVTSVIVQGEALHGVYAEAFAVWLVALNLLSVVAALVSEVTGLGQFTVLLVCFPASLVALWWPSLRGSSLSRTLADIGVTRGRGVGREIGAGVVGWMAMLPIQGLGILCTMVLMRLAGVAEGDAEAPSHPIIDALGDPAAAVSAFIVAVVLAPIVEEIAFRGLLYRQLRSTGPLCRGVVGVLGSAVLTGLLFAAVHPQGWMAIPALMAIAIAVALAREWRGSLIAPMCMHAINNALAVTALLIIIMA